jgi:hypothetical protein
MSTLHAAGPYLAGETLIICVDGENYRFGRKFRWMRGSRRIV